MRSRLFLIPVALSSAGCREAPDRPETPVESPARHSSGPVTTSASASAHSSAKGVSVAERTDAYVFEYAYPGAARGHKVLERFFEEDRAAIRADLAQAAKASMDEANAASSTLNPYSYATGWEVVADVPRYLSLSAGFSSYRGGAHGLNGVRSIVFDRNAGAVLEPSQFFGPGLSQALAPQYCPLLDREREARRGEPVDKSDPEDFFSTCPDLAETTILLGSSNGRSFDRLTLYFGPYVAGPYAEGDYEIDLDIDAAVLKAVKPQYASDFSIRRR